MSGLQTGEINSDERENKIDLELKGANLAFVILAPHAHKLPAQDLARWQLTAHLAIALDADDTPSEPLALPSIVLPPTQAKQQIAAVLYWPQAGIAPAAGRLLTASLFWSCDTQGVRARVAVLSTHRSQSADACGLFTVPFPSAIELAPYPPRLGK